MTNEEIMAELQSLANRMHGIESNNRNMDLTFNQLFQSMRADIKALQEKQKDSDDDCLYIDEVGYITENSDEDHTITVESLSGAIQLKTSDGVDVIRIIIKNKDVHKLINLLLKKSSEQ